MRTRGMRGGYMGKLKNIDEYIEKVQGENT
jgi:hypothetical protein